jgi:penicillin-insensitive murein endopeptidase
MGLAAVLATGMATRRVRQLFAFGRMTACALGVAAVAGASGCARAPSPLTPHWGGSIGMPHRGVLTQATELPAVGDGYRVLASNDRHFGTPRFVAAIERAAAKVTRERPGSMLVVGDLSARNGGKISSHSSHRSGRDADLLLYMTTLEGAPVAVTSFVHVGTDGLAWNESESRFLRFDVERQWLLVKALVEDPEARVQWLFVSKNVEALLIDWARARGESAETLVRAMDTLLQPPPPAQSHDDHVHVRVACDPDEIAAGCEPTGPVRPWIAAADASTSPSDVPSTLELVQSLVQPIDPLGPALAGVPTDGRAKNGE